MSQPVKVALFVASMRGGGAERVMATVANELSRKGYEVDLLLAKKEGPYLEEVESTVNIIDFNCSRVLYSLPKLTSYLRRSSPNSLLSAVTHVNIIAILAKLFSFKKIFLVISQRGAPKVSSDGSSIGRLGNYLLRMCYPLADRIISVSDGVKAQLVSEFGIAEHKVISIPNPIQLAETKALSVESVSHKWVHNEHHPILLAAGRLNPVKDYRTMLRSVAIIRKEVDARLIVLGQGDQIQELLEFSKELEIDDFVDFVGFQENPYAWMSKCDVFLLSSESEGFPNSLVQAMACGAPVVSTDCQFGPSEILENGKWGKLTPVGDPEQFAAAILTTLNSSVHPDGKKRANNFSAEAIVGEYERALGLSSLKN